MKHIVVDLEMNPLSSQYREEKAKCKNEVIEFGAVALDDDYQEIGSFQSFVKPQYSEVIQPYLVELTGITIQMVADAPVFAEALKQFLDWCRGFGSRTLIYQWSDSDLAQLLSETRLKKIRLNEEELRLLSGWVDFQKEYGEKLHLSQAVSLKNAVMYAGIDFEGRQHDALYDARNTASLLRIVRDPALCDRLLGVVIDTFTPKSAGTTLGSMFDFTALGFSA